MPPLISRPLPCFRFALEQPVIIQSSEEEGIVMGRSEYVRDENQYLVARKLALGRLSDPQHPRDQRRTAGETADRKRRDSRRDCKQPSITRSHRMTEVTEVTETTATETEPVPSVETDDIADVGESSERDAEDDSE